MNRFRFHQLLISIIISAVLIVQGGACSVVWAEEIENGKDSSSGLISSEDNLGDVENLLIYDGEQCTEDELSEMKENKEIKYDGYIYKLKDQVTSSEVETMEENIDALQDGEIGEISQGELYTADSVESISEVVEADKVEYVEPDMKCSLMSVDDEEMKEYLNANKYSSTPNDSFYRDSRFSWAFYGTKNNPGIGVDKAWDRGFFGQDANLSRKVVVTCIDTGVDPNLKDANYDRILPQVTIIDGVETDGYVDKADHGTFVSGVINEKMNNALGSCGYMPDLYVRPISVFTANALGKKTGGKLSDILIAMDKAVASDTDVINMSLGFDSYSRSLSLACDMTAAQGIIIVAAAGNDGDSSAFYPACFDSVISVGSVSNGSNDTFNRSEFSNYNKYVDVVAPGDRLAGLASAAFSEGRDYYYDFKIGSGTSFATPVVSSLAGMCKSAVPNMDINTFRELLSVTCDDLGAKGRDNEYGWGLVDFDEVSDILQNKNLSYATMSISATSFNYTGDYIRPKVTLTLLGRKLVEGKDYTLEYSKNRNVGKAAVRAVAVEGSGYSGSKGRSYKIMPLGTSLKNSSVGKTYITTRWKKQSRTMASTRVTGYNIQIAKNSSFTSGKISKNLGSYEVTERKFGNLKCNTNYYVRVRTYRKLNGVRYYSDWSPIQKCRTR